MHKAKPVEIRILRSFPPGCAQRQQAFQAQILNAWQENPGPNQFQEAF